MTLPALYLNLSYYGIAPPLWWRRADFGRQEQAEAVVSGSVVDKSGHRSVEKFDGIVCRLEGELHVSELEPERVGSLWDFRLWCLVDPPWHPAATGCLYGKYVGNA